MILKQSPLESELFQLKIARSSAYLASIEEKEIIKALTRHHYDIARIKVRGDSSNLFHTLESLNLPYHIYAVNYRNEKIIEQVPEFAGGKISYEPYSPDKKGLLLNMLATILQSKYWFEYQSDLLRMFFPKKLEFDLAIQYYSSFHPGKRDNGRTWFLKYKNEYVGLFMGYVEEDCFEGTLYGILPQYRNKGFSKDIYKAMFFLCHQNNWQKFRNDVNIFNVISQQSGMRSLLDAKGIYFNIILFSLLDKSIEPVEEWEYKGDTGKVRWWAHIHEAISKRNANFNISRFYHKWIRSFKVPAELKLVLTCPYASEDKAIVVIKIFNEDKTELLGFNQALLKT